MQVIIWVADAGASALYTSGQFQVRVSYIIPIACGEIPQVSKVKLRVYKILAL